jgi:hypothetical protein
MKYKQFKKLWEKYIPSDVKFICEHQTMQALIEYGEGNKSKIQEVRKFLATTEIGETIINPKINLDKINFL